MKRVFVEAFEDESRPQGGHAVILVQGLESIADRPQFRLKPLDGGFIQAKRTGAKSSMLAPVATRLTESGVELVVGPDIVGNPLLLAGTPVVIEIADAGVRGEFLWPSVAPMAPPRRRNVVVSQRKARLGVPAPGAHSAAAAATFGGVDIGSTAHEDGRLASAGETRLTTAGGAADARASQLAAGAPAPALATSHASSPAPPSAPAPAILSDAPFTPTSSLAAAAGMEPAAPAPARPELHIGVPASPGPSGEIHWHGRQAERRARRKRWLAPGLAACAVTGLLAAYLSWGRQQAPALSTAIAFNRPRATKPVQPEPGLERTAAVTDASRAPHAARENGGSPEIAALSPSGSGAASVACGKPEVSTDPLDGGRMRIRITAPCRGDEDVRLAYAGATFVHRLDINGALDLIFDCFAGVETPVEVRFADGRSKSVPVVATDFSGITKVAVVWRAPVNLDLHAFEYAARRGERGHVSEQAPRTVSAAQRDLEQSRRGHGFMSATGSGSNAGDKVEVYTFLHSDEQTAGAVDMALDYETRGDNPAAGTCGTDENAEVSYRLMVLARGKMTMNEPGRIAAAVCGVPVPDEVRYSRGVLPVLKVRK